MVRIQNSELRIQLFRIVHSKKSNSRIVMFRILNAESGLQNTDLRIRIFRYKIQKIFRIEIFRIQDSDLRFMILSIHQSKTLNNMVPTRTNSRSSYL